MQKLRKLTFKNLSQKAFSLPYTLESEGKNNIQQSLKFKITIIGFIIYLMQIIINKTHSEMNF